jgi:threonyl-tRNA synthetase
VLPIAERHLAHARAVEQTLASAGIRADVDPRNEKLGFKVREAEIQKIPMMLVVGDQEQASGTVTPRARQGAPTGSGAVPVDALVAQLVRDISERRNTRRP